MKKHLFIILIVTIILLYFIPSALSAEPGKLSLSITAGNAADIPTLQLEFEYKSGPWAAAVHAGYAGGIYGGGLEVGLLGRYCIDLSKGWDFYLLLDPSVLITYYEGPNVSSLWDLGLGIEYRATHLRVSLDAGPSLIVNSYNSDVFTLFFGKLGIGYIF